MSPIDKDSWIEGPLPRLLQPSLLELNYLLSTGTQRYEQTIDPAAEVLQLNGRLHDIPQQYTLQRNPEPPKWEQQVIEKILLLGDQHGHYDKLITFLQVHEVIDAEANWQWGKGQLVMCGDLMDRGLAVLPLLWLLCRLEQQAALAGGAVHVLLGNHELMVMQGDYRYVHPELLQLYRKAGMRYGEPFGPDWYFGRWLRSRHAVIKLNDLLIAHAGISPAIARYGFSLQEINSLVQKGIDATLRSEKEEALLTNEGPLWYRGYVMDSYYYKSATAAEARQVLEQYGANKMVVAHTPVRHIQQRLQGQVWAIDLDIESPHVRVEGLQYESGDFAVLMPDGSRKDVASA